MEFDFWEMEPAAAEKATDAFNVSVLATSRLWVSQLWRDCRKSGLDCWAVDGVPLAMARAVGAGRRRDRRAPGAGRRLGLFEHDAVRRRRRTAAVQPADSRLCVSAACWTRSCGVFDVTLDEAQHLVDTQGFASRQQTATVARRDRDHASGDYAGGRGQPLEELVRQIRRTLQFTEAQRRHLQPAAIWLMGGGASMRNVGPYLAEQTGASRARLDDAARRRADCVRGRASGGRVQRRGGAVGRGLEGSMRTMINLLPARLPPAANRAQASHSMERRSCASCW